MTNIDSEFNDAARQKKVLRDRIIAERMELSGFDARRYSDRISDELKEYARNRTVICSYAAFRGEVDLTEFHGRVLAEGKVLLLPRIKGKNMDFYEVSSLQDLVKNKMGIPEPVPERSVHWDDRDIWESNPLVITPGVAFSKGGARIGYGGGFYDRFFSKSCGRGLRIGVCYKIQILPELPTEPHDASVDAVVYAPKKVVIGLSGGVDSAVAAHILKEQGYEVIGLWLGMWKKMSDDSGENPELNDAANVAKKLGIEFKALDKSDEFRKTVVNYFIGEYLSGRTPNPCIHCNRLMKFKSLTDYADAVGAEYIATGHYAKITRSVDGRYEVSVPLDERKDQSYMLAMLTQQQLSRTLTPLASVRNKEEVRHIAAKLGFHISQKKDSQEICFVEGSYLDFLKGEGAKGMSGSFVLDGKRVRAHDGIESYTVGQRKGLGAFGKPVFVVDINSDTGDVVLGSNEELFGVSLEAGGLNFVALREGDEIGRCEAKIRYAAKACPCSVNRLGADRVQVDFDEPQRAITPGQSVVFYRDGVVLASAVIEKKLR